MMMALSAQHRAQVRAAATCAAVPTKGQAHNLRRLYATVHLPLGPTTIAS